MSFPRLTILILPLVLGLPLMAGGCAPAAVTAASYGADGVSLADTGKTTGDHFTSMVTKKDCAFWRALRNQNICREREGDRDPYQVNYNEPFRDQGEGAGVQYHAPLRAARGPARPPELNHPTDAMTHARGRPRCCCSGRCSRQSLLEP